MSYTIVIERLEDGKFIKLSENNIKYSVFGLETMISREMHPSRLQQMEAIIQSGERVWFRTQPPQSEEILGIDADGIIYAPRGKEKHLDWEELAGGEVKDGMLRLYSRHGARKKSWLYKRTFFFSNYTLLERLINQQLQKRGMPAIQYSGSRVMYVDKIQYSNAPTGGQGYKPE